MRKRIGSLVNGVLSNLGYELTRRHGLLPATTGVDWLRRLGVRTLVDIGSNEGQFILDFAKALPGTRIFAFEPIEACHRRLVANTAGLDVKAYHTALGAVAGEAEINVSQNKHSSSILPMEELHRSNFPDSEYVRKEKVRVERLDDVLADAALQPTVLIKLDVQGFEKNVIDGGTSTFAKADVVIVESIFQSFYVGQWLFDDLHRHFTESGFRFNGFVEQVFDRRNGLPLYGDAIFIRGERMAELG